MAAKVADIKSRQIKGAYEKSTIRFPYGDLDEALSVADAIHKNAGISCSVDQLAAYVGQTTKSGAFRLKLSTTRTFGLIETEKGSVSLTDLGRQIVDGSKREQAKASAFLAVPLYSAVFEKYRGHPLPPATALEQEMAGLGVAPKQISKARNAFERSAEQAGFFKLGKDRLVAPTFGGAIPKAPETRTARGASDTGLHPFIQGLLRTLPAPDSVWPTRERQKWIQTAENIFSLIYEDDESEVG